MSERFDFSSIFRDEMWTIHTPNADGAQEKFFRLIKDEFEKTQFPNVDISLDEYVTGGLLFNKETTRMLKIKSKNSQFKKYEVYFRAQVFGNVVVLSVMFCMEQGFLGAIIGKGGPELFAQVRSKCKNMAQYEEFTALDNLGVLLFQDALLSIDDRYKERKALAS